MENKILVAVCGAHMSGLPLNHQLTHLSGKLHTKTSTTPHYRLFRLAGFEPARPGLVRVASEGVAIDLEIWELPIENYGRFVAGIPHPLCIGTLTLADGAQVQGFLCEGYATLDALDISDFSGWRQYISSI